MHVRVTHLWRVLISLWPVQDGTNLLSSSTNLGATVRNPQHFVGGLVIQRQIFPVCREEWFA